MSELTNVLQLAEAPTIRILRRSLWQEKRELETRLESVRSGRVSRAQHRRTERRQDGKTETHGRGREHAVGGLFVHVVRCYDKGVWEANENRGLVKTLKLSEGANVDVGAAPTVG